MQEKPDTGNISTDATIQNRPHRNYDGTEQLRPVSDTQAAAGEDRSLEELFAEAEALVDRMEEPELSLEDAFAAYEQGMRIIRACNSRIDQVEQKMLVMNEEGGLEPFE